MGFGYLETIVYAYLAEGKIAHLKWDYVFKVKLRMGLASMLNQDCKS